MKSTSKLFRFCLAAFAFSFLRCIPAFSGEASAPPGHQTFTIKAGGLERHYLLHLPPNYDKSHALPLVVMLHGGGGKSETTVRETGWSAKADKAGFIVAYPDATPPDRTKPGKFRGNPQTWNDGSGRFPSQNAGIDDVAFLRAMLDDIAGHFAVDPKRIYFTGFSNGASMTFYVGAKLSDRVAAIAPVAGAWWPEELNLKRGVPMCYITGIDDPLNPLKGGPLKFGLGGKDKPPVQESIDKWVKAIGAPAKPESVSETNGVHILRYGPGRDGAVVQFITVEGLGHVWAGGENLLPEFLVGKPTDKLNACDVIWDFFSKQSLK
jgi:polyhydroxybutyrate depolymerase